MKYSSIIGLLLLSLVVHADVVKPALVEISANTNGSVSIELRASIEALLTGINGRYKNTQEAPQAEAYDALRVLSAKQLAEKFQPFQTKLLQQIELLADGQPVALHIDRVDIPEAGYTKVPRISVIYLRGELARSTQNLRWYYPLAFGDNAVRVRQVDEAQAQWHWSDWQWIKKDQHSEPFSLTELFTRKPTSDVILDYIGIGFDHIIPLGLDHVLFILGIYLLSVRWSPLLWQVTMFTVAHTITLGLSMAGWISLPANIVEPLIALSIAYVALENVFVRDLHKFRLVLVFAFGLLHGLGFADMLADFGMPNDAFFTALVSFNVGVELGQLAVIGIAFVLTAWFRQKTWYNTAIVVPSSLLIAMMGLYWTIERLEFI
jgi:hypothetical protein